jgi:hypothetical protein
VTRHWLTRIADAVERWLTMPRDNVEVAMTTTTPAGAMIYIASTIVDAGERAAVQAALPTIATDDFAEAARQIRRAADALPSN